MRCLGAHRAVDGQEKHCCTGDMRIGSTVMPSCDLTARHSAGPRSRCLPGGACIYDSEITWPATAISRCTRCRNGPHTCSQTSATGMYSVMLSPSNCIFEIASWTTVLLEPPLFMTPPSTYQWSCPACTGSQLRGQDPKRRTDNQAEPNHGRKSTRVAAKLARTNHNTHIKRAKKTGCATTSDNEPLAQPHEYEGVLYHTAHHHIILHVSDNHLLNMQCQLWGSNPRAVACSGS